MKDFARRLRRLERGQTATNQGPPAPGQRLTPQQLIFINNDRGAIEAAQVFAQAYVEQVQATTDWRFRDNPEALFAETLRHNPAARPAWERFGVTYRAACGGEAAVIRSRIRS